MAEVKESSILIQDVETKNIMTKSAPVYWQELFAPAAKVGSDAW